MVWICPCSTDPARTSSRPTRRTVRRTIALRAKLAEDVKTGRCRLVNERAARRTKRETNHHQAKREAIESDVCTAMPDVDPDLLVEAVERMTEEVQELLYDCDEFAGFMDRPVGETVARLCKALGLDPPFCVPDGDGWKIRRKPYAFEVPLPPSPPRGGTDGEAVRVGSADLSAEACKAKMEASSGPAGFP